jgi:tRNA pseudouridine38-40 synthase
LNFDNNHNLVGTKYRFRLDLSYDGTNYHGWASQTNLATVQTTIETVLKRITRDFTNLDQIYCAGRTDTGVHAWQQVAHLDLRNSHINKILGKVTNVDFAQFATILRYKLNSLLPNDIVINKITRVSSKFDARHSVLRRTYKYYISNDISKRLATSSRFSFWVDNKLDVDSMNLAAGKLVGENDFYSFIKNRPEQSTIRDLQNFSWQFSVSSGLIVASLTANAFAHNMVRCLVGASLMVGKGYRQPEWLYQSLLDKKRKASLGPAPAKGLFLYKIDYPMEFVKSSLD